MNKLLNLAAKAAVKGVIAISYSVFWKFDRITWPLRILWTSRGKRIQAKLNEEHGTNYQYYKCNL